MSAENLKFFATKTDEEIITWMLQNLSETQIKMCLDSKSGTPPSGPSGPRLPLDATEPRLMAAASGIDESVLNVGAVEPAELGRELSSPEKSLLLTSASTALLDEASSPSPEFVRAIAESVPPTVSRGKGKERAVDPSLELAMAIQREEAAGGAGGSGTQPQAVDLLRSLQPAALDSALKAQLGMSSKKENSPMFLTNILKNYFSLPPFFIVGADSKKVYYYRLIVQGPNVTFVRDETSMTASVRNKKWKKQIAELDLALNIPEWDSRLKKLPKRVNTALSLIPSEDSVVVKQLYDPNSLKRIDKLLDSDVPLFFGKLVDQSDEFLVKYGTNKFGPEFMTKFKPNKSINKFGVRTLQWVKH